MRKPSELLTGHYACVDGWVSADNDWKYDLEVEIESVAKSGAVASSSSWTLRRR